ncbi:MAG: hypothetical protein BBJ57_12020 [Desulfobacterales bacterium PC51MH44]|nr:MAG: hypothetical protein BBJ57_12020 [Desulfobacterales bacterium PC51MH44]
MKSENSLANILISKDINDEAQTEKEVRRKRDVSQWKLIRDRSQISKEIQHQELYYKEGFVSKKKRLRNTIYGKK